MFILVQIFVSNTKKKHCGSSCIKTPHLWISPLLVFNQKGNK